MHRERVSEDVHVFTSDLYVQVTASVVFTPEGVILVDTLPFPSETKELREFVLANTNKGIRYLINTHFHADHVYGSYLFPEAELVAHSLCRQMLERYGQKSLAEAKAQVPELAEVQLRLPEVVFDSGEALLHLGGKTLQMIPMPGHTDDSLVVYIKEDKILLASDTLMPLPYIVWGDREVFIESLRKLLEMPVECVVQGHGEVLLRGEVRDAVMSSINYLEAIWREVQRVVDAGLDRSELEEITVESCGKSRIPLDGLVQQLHQDNLQALYDALVREEQEGNGNGRQRGVI
jgi:cyclase